MEIVANSTILKKFKNIDIFELNLGFNLKGAVNMNPGKGVESKIKMKIRDEFIVKYNNLYNRYISKFGSIGTLVFYEDLNLNSNEIHIYKDKDIYEVIFTEDDKVKDMRQYLSELLESLDAQEERVDVNTVYTNMPDEIVRPDISMPKEQYIQSLIENRDKSWQNFTKQNIK